MKKIISLLLLSLSGATFAGTCTEKSLWGGWEAIGKKNIFESIAFESTEQGKTFNYWLSGEKENKEAIWKLNGCKLEIQDNQKKLFIYQVNIENSKKIQLINKENNKVFNFQKMRD